MLVSCLDYDSYYRVHLVVLVLHLAATNDIIVMDGIDQGIRINRPFARPRIGRMRRRRRNVSDADAADHGIEASCQSIMMMMQRCRCTHAAAVVLASLSLYVVCSADNPIVGGRFVVSVYAFVPSSSGRRQIHHVGRGVPWADPSIQEAARPFRYETIIPETTIKTSTSLNGIKGFRAWFERTFPTAVVPIPRGGNNSKPSSNSDPKSTSHSETFDHVLIDVNQLLHVSMRRSEVTHPRANVDD